MGKILIIFLYLTVFGIEPDTTSRVYFSASPQEMSEADSANLYMPFSSENEGVIFTAFGIKAEYVKVNPPVYDRFHIDLNKDRFKEVYPWQVFLPLLFCVVLILLARFYVSDSIRRVFLAVFYDNAFQNAVSEKNVNADKAGYMLFICYLVNAVLVICVCLFRYGSPFVENFGRALMILIAAVTGFYVIKRIISGVLAGLFGCRDIFSLYYKRSSFIFQALGVVLTVVNFISFYVASASVHDFAFYFTVILCVFAEIWKIFKLFSIIFEKRFPIFYLFLYLCGVEFLPAVYAVKILSA